MDGSPLSGREAIALLTRTGALEKLRAQGYQAVNFTAAVPFNEPVLSGMCVVMTTSAELSIAYNVSSIYQYETACAVIRSYIKIFPAPCTCSD